MKRRFWTEQENQMLRDRYPIEGITVALQQTLSRGRISIRHQASRLGLISDFRWNSDDDKILRTSYHELSLDEIAVLLTTSRTPVAIRVHAIRLGLGEQRKWSPTEDSILKESYSEGDWNKMLTSLPNRTKIGIARHARYIGLSVSKSTIRRTKQNQHLRQGNNTVWSYGRVLGSVIVRCHTAAVKRDIECPLLDGSEDNMRYLDSIACDTCALSGLPLVYATKARDMNTTASLDRIDSSKGYSKGNVQWIHKVVNLMKLDMVETDFVAFCSAVARQRGEFQ